MGVPFTVARPCRTLTGFRLAVVDNGPTVPCVACMAKTASPGVIFLSCLVTRPVRPVGHW